MIDSLKEQICHTNDWIGSAISGMDKLIRKYIDTIPTHEIVGDLCETKLLGYKIHGGLVDLKRVFLAPDPLCHIPMLAYETKDGEILYSSDINRAATVIEVATYIQYIYEVKEGHDASGFVNKYY